LSSELLDATKAHSAHSAKHGLAPLTKTHFHVLLLRSSQLAVPQSVNNPASHGVLHPNAYVCMKPATSLRLHRSEERLHEAEKARRHQSSRCTVSEPLPSVDMHADAMFQVQADHEVRKDSLGKWIL
jgi:hypothetical protein